MMYWLSLKLFYFSKKTEMVMHSADSIAPVGYINLKECKLEDKEWVTELSYF